MTTPHRGCHIPTPGGGLGFTLRNDNPMGCHMHAPNGGMHLRNVFFRVASVNPSGLPAPDAPLRGAMHTPSGYAYTFSVHVCACNFGQKRCILGLIFRFIFFLPKMCLRLHLRWKTIKNMWGLYLMHIWGLNDDEHPKRRGCGLN